MRLFTALLPPDHILDGSGQLADKVAELRVLDGAGQLRWIDRANWHITLAFYGEVADGQLGGLHERLSRAAGRGRPLRLRIAGGGHFGGRALWAGIADGTYDGDPADETDGTEDADRTYGGHPADGPASPGAQGASPGSAVEGVRRLAATTAAAGRRLGLGTDEPRRFRAHLTLARARAHRFDPRPYTTALDEFAGEPWTAGELALVRSNLPEGGMRGEQPRYERIAAWPLGG